MSTSDDTLKIVGQSAAAAIAEMVAALECDYDRLDYLKDGLESEGLIDIEAREELHDLQVAAGECTSREDAETRIQEDALCVEMRSGWVTNRDALSVPEEFAILLSTGGPASRIRGELVDGEPVRAWLEVQDWGTPWTQVFGIEQDTLLSYAR